MTSLTDTQVVTASGGLVELGYAESDANLVISATTGAGMDNISPELTVVCDGGPIMVEFFCAGARATVDAAGTTDALLFTLKVDGSVEEERLGVVGNVAGGYGSLTPIKLSHRMTPSAGSHTFRVGGWVSNAGRTGYIGGGSPYPPAWIRVSKIVQATQWPAVTTGTIICTSSTRPASPFEGQKIYETDTGLSLIYDGSAWVSPSVTHKPPMCKAYGNTTVPDASDTTCSFSTEVFDTDGIFAPTSTDFTIQTAGVYLFTAEVNLNGTSNVRGDVYIQKNGSGWLARTTLYGTVERFPVTVTDNASAGDVYTVRVYQDNTSSASKNCTVTFTALWQGQA